MSSSNKRERELARLKFERQQQRRLEQGAARRRRNQVIAVIAALVVVVGGVTALWLSSRSSSDTTASPGSSPSPSVSGSVSPSPSVSVAGCTTPATPTTKTQTWKAPAGPTLVASTTYTMTLDTNCGQIVIELDQKAPKTSSSMLFLADEGFYTDSDCFRLTTSGIFVLQCGSPTNNGQGGPGYSVPDENLPSSGSNNYPAGTVAMANAGAGTSGSQFFIVYKNTTLPASYTIWGKVVSGLDVVTKVAAAGVIGGSADGAPVQPIVITKATTSETPQAG